MERRINKLLILMLALVLVTGIALAVSSTEAYAGGDVPAPEDVYIDVDPKDVESGTTNSHFTSTKLYYSSDTKTFSSNGDNGYDAKYDPSTGELLLWNYYGRSIVVDAPIRNDITIVLAKDNYIVTDRQFGIYAEGLNVIITSEKNGSGDYLDASLTINDHYYWADGSGGGIVNFWEGDAGTAVTIKGKAKVNVDFSAGGSAYGIKTGGALILQDDAELDVNVKYGEYGKQISAAVYTNGHVMIENTGRVNLSIAARDNLKGLTAYALYYGGQFAMDDSYYSGAIRQGCLYFSLSAVGKNPKISNKSLPKKTYEGNGYYDSTVKSKYTVSRYYRSEYENTEWIPLNGYFFPDPSFRDYVADAFSDWQEEDFPAIDDGWIVVNALAGNTSLYMYGNPLEGGKDDFDDAYSVRGIEYMTNLQEFEWYNGHLKEFDISKNKNLEEVYVSRNQIDTLKLPSSSKLKILSCNDNKLTSLSLSNPTKLVSVYCRGNKLKSLNVSKLSYLEELDCGNNLLTTLDVSKNKKLNWLSCANDLVVIPDDEWPIEYTSYNNIGFLDVSSNTKLQTLMCYRNNMKSLELGSNLVLSTLFCYSNDLGILDIRKCPILKNVYSNGTVDSQGQYYTEYRVTYSDIMRIDGGDTVYTKDPTAYAQSTGATLNLEGRLDIMFFVKLPGGQTTWTAKTFFESDGYDSARSTSALKKSDSSVWDSGNSRFVVTCPNVEAKQMTQYAMLKVYDKNGKQVMIKKGSEYVTDIRYSAADWANSMIDKEDARNMPLAKALLNYGQTAQEYFGYMTGRPAIKAGSALAAEMESRMASVTAKSKYNVEFIKNADAVAAVKCTGATLNLVGDTEIMVLFSSSAPVVKVNGKTVTLNKYGSRWYASIPNIAAKDLGVKQTVNISYSGKTATVKYAALSWANSKLGKTSTDEEIKNDKMARALYIYYDEAYDYFN